MDLFTSSYSDKPNIVIDNFPDGEDYIKLPLNLKPPFKLHHRLYPNPNNSLLQLLLISNHLSRLGPVEAVVPYLPYSRQDKSVLPGEFPLIYEVLSLLRKSGISKVYTYDCHFLKGKPSFEWEGLTIVNDTLAPKLIEYAIKQYFDNKTPLIIAPDEGATYMLPDPKYHLSKSRGDYTHNKSSIFRPVEDMEISFDVNGRDVLIIDDLIAGGGTMRRAVKLLRDMGANKIVCASVHALNLNNSLDKLFSLCDGLIVSNTIKTPYSVKLI